MNFLASPPLVVAYAIAGNMKLDLYNDPLGMGKDGKPVYLRDVWPSTKEIHDLISKHVTSTQFKSSYASVFEGDANWMAVATPEGENFTWDDSSTYVKNPPYFEGMTAKPGVPQNITERARAGDARRFGDDGPHLAGGQHRGNEPGREISREPRRHAQGLQFLRRAPRQPRGHGARHVREHPLEEPARAGHRGRCHRSHYRAASSCRFTRPP